MLLCCSILYSLLCSCNHLACPFSRKKLSSTSQALFIHFLSCLCVAVEERTAFVCANSGESTLYFPASRQEGDCMVIWWENKKTRFYYTNVFPYIHRKKLTQKLILFFQCLLKFEAVLHCWESGRQTSYLHNPSSSSRKIGSFVIFSVLWSWWLTVRVHNNCILVSWLMKHCYYKGKREVFP